MSSIDIKRSFWIRLTFCCHSKFKNRVLFATSFRDPKWSTYRKHQKITPGNPGTHDHTLPVSRQVTTSAAHSSPFHHGPFVFKRSSKAMQEHFWVLEKKTISTCCQRRTPSQRSQGYTIIYNLPSGNIRIQRLFSEWTTSNNWNQLDKHWGLHRFPTPRCNESTGHIALSVAHTMCPAAFCLHHWKRIIQIYPNLGP